MLSRSLIAVLGLSALSLSLPASARDPIATPDIDQRLYEQQRRIDRGLRTGQLTSREAHRLGREQGRIRHDLHLAKADGIVTGQERRHIQQALDRSAAEIARERRDQQHDYNHDGRPDRMYR